MASDEPEDAGPELTPEDRERIIFVSEAAAKALRQWNAEAGAQVAKAFEPFMAQLRANQAAILGASGFVETFQRANAQIAKAFAPEIQGLFTGFASQWALQTASAPRVSVSKELTLRWQVEASIEEVEELAAAAPTAPLDVLLLVLLVLALVAQAAGLALHDEQAAKASALGNYLLIVAMIHQARPH